MLNIINTEAVMMFLFIIFIGSILSLMTFFLIKHVYLYGDKTEKRMIIGASILTAILIIF